MHYNCRESRQQNILFSKSMYQFKQVAIAALLCAFAPAIFAQTGQISGLLNKITVHAGQTFDVVWYADPGENPVAVIDFVLTYDPQFLKALDAQRSPSSPLNAHQVETKIDEQAGQIVFGVFRLSQPWPDTLFPFIKTEFAAKAATPHTALTHDLSKVPYTVMAHAGNNTMAKAENISITVLPEITPTRTPAGDSEPGFIVETSDTSVLINFSVEKKGTVILRLRNSDDVLIAEMLEMMAAPGINYAFGMNDSLLEPGTYVIELQDASGTRTRMVVVEK